MNGYIRNKKVGYTLTIVDNSGTKHHYDIFNMDKFCNRFMSEPKEVVLQQKSIGNYILKKFGFCFDVELDYFTRDSFVSP
jgi:hypothetical protein